MRILSISAQKPNSTGSGVYLTETVRGFASLGHDQAVLAGIYEQDQVSLPDGVAFYPVYFDTPQLPFHIAGMSDEMPYPSTVYSQMTPEMTGQFAESFSKALMTAVAEFKPDVLLCHHLYLLTAIVRKLFPDLSVWGICHGTDLRQMAKNPLWRDEIREQICGLDKVFCLHEEQRSQAIACYNLDPCRVTVVGNGYNEQIFYDRGQRVPHAERRLVFAGKISEKKGVFSLLRALPLLGWDKDQFSLLMAGGWSNESQKQYVEKLIAESGYNVSLSGNLRQEQLAEEFNRGDIFVLPSFYDGLPLVLAESMACGMQVVCSDLPGIRPWMDAHVPHHTIRFVKPPRMHDADVPDPATLPRFEQELAEAIREAAEHPYLQRPDLSLVSWPGVCRRILAAR